MLQPVSETRKIAEAFVGARMGKHALADYPGALPATFAEAYAIQDEAISLYGGSIVGWKVGRINPPWLERLGTTRLSGPIFADSVKSIAGNPPGLIFKGGFGAAEAEFVYRIGQSPDPAQTSFSTADVTSLIDAVFCGFEIASSPYPGINVDGPLVTVSDFGNNHGLLLGPEISDWQTADFNHWVVSTYADGMLLGEGKAAAFPGGSIESVRCLLENLGSRGHPILPGLLISSGAVTGVHEVKAGQVIESRFGNFATLNCQIEHAA